jgi:hypothetical protein
MQLENFRKFSRLLDGRSKIIPSDTGIIDCTSPFSENRTFPVKTANMQFSPVSTIYFAKQPPQPEKISS